MAGRSSRALVVVMVVALLAAPPACSFIFVKPPPPTDVRGTIVHCTASDVAPLVDLLLAAGEVARFLIVYSASDAEYANNWLSRDGNMVLSGALFGLFAASSTMGFWSTKECREALALANEEPPSPPRRRPSPRLNVAPSPKARTPDPAQESGRDGGASPDPDAAPPLSAP